MESLRRRLIAGTINRYEAKGGWRNDHLDKSPRVLPDGMPPEIVADIAALPLPNDSYDEIVCSQTLEHLPYARACKALREFHRVLKPHGTLHLDTPDMAAVARAWVGHEYTPAELELIVYGDVVEMPDAEFNVHRSAWWPERLETELIEARFSVLSIKSKGVILWGEARKT